MSERIGVLEGVLVDYEALKTRVTELEDNQSRSLPSLPLDDDPEVNAWLNQLDTRIPINSKDHMDDLNRKLGTAAWMTAAVDHFSVYVVDKRNLKPLFNVVFGDWVTDNVTFQRPLVSLILSTRDSSLLWYNMSSWFLIISSFFCIICIRARRRLSQP